MFIDLLSEFLECKKEEIIEDSENDIDCLQAYKYNDKKYVVGDDITVEKAIIQYMLNFIDTQIIPNEKDEVIFNENIEKLELFNKNNRAFIIASDGEEHFYKDTYIYRIE